MKTNFGIKYNETSTFQPDFIVKFNNGYIGIFDTKPINFNVEDTASKSNALSNYIKEEKKKGKYLVGGIVVDKGNNFMINQNLNSNYKDYQDEPNNWQYFSELFK
jgi:type III restriction enzyme